MLSRGISKEGWNENPWNAKEKAKVACRQKQLGFLLSSGPFIWNQQNKKKGPFIKEELKITGARK